VLNIFIADKLTMQTTSAQPLTVYVLYNGSWDRGTLRFKHYL